MSFETQIVAILYRRLRITRAVKRYPNNHRHDERDTFFPNAINM